MMGPSILDRYIFREIFGSFFFCFAIFLLTGLVAGFLPILQAGLRAGTELTLILFKCLINAVPGTLVTVLPLSLMIGILMGLGRMSADNEVAAIKSAGISVVRLLPPVAVLGLIAFGLSLLCTLVLIPKGIAEGQRLTNEARTSKGITALIEERTFFDVLKGLILYAETIDPASGELTHIFIKETLQPGETTTIVARKGRITPDPKGEALVITLNDGTILREGEEGNLTRRVEFESYLFRYPLDRAVPVDDSKPMEAMPIPEILAKLKNLNPDNKPITPEFQEYQDRVNRKARIYIAQRFSHPLACLVLALVAFPLGALNMGKSRLNNVAAGLVVIFLYYAATLAAEKAAHSGFAPPELSLLAVPVLFTGIAIYFTRCVRLERVPWIIRVVMETVHKVRRTNAVHVP
jgi:lipopolysaccharide export system permease protein